MQKGVATLFHSDNLRLELGNEIILIKLCVVDEATGKQMCSIEVELAVRAVGQMVRSRAFDGLALKSESAELWHRRMEHINHKSLDVMGKETARCVDYTGDLKNCSSCPLGKSAKHPRPKQVSYNYP